MTENLPELLVPAQPDDFDPLNSMFSLMLGAKWLHAERYRTGAYALIKECTSKSELDAVEHLLKNLEYCTSKDVEEASIAAAHAIINDFKLLPENTLVVGLAEGRKPCGSMAYLRAMETKLPREWGAAIWTAFDAAFRQRAGQSNLVVVDDFVGSGEKLLTRIKRLKDNPKTADYKLYVIAFAGMNEGLTKIADEVDNLIHAHLVLDKCIDKAQYPASKDKLYEGMSLLETNIFDKPGVYSYGYKKSEAAFYLEGANMPNNNFPILWWDKYTDDTARPTLFYRR